MGVKTKYSPKNGFLLSGIGILIIFISITSLFAAFNIADVKNPFFNPPPNEHNAMFSLPIVPISSTPAKPVDSTISFIIHYTGDVIVARQPVTIEGLAEPIDNETLPNILIISLTFEGSSAYYPNIEPGTQTQYPPPGVIYITRELNGGWVLRPDINNAEIFWQTSGNFAPVLTITYENSSQPRTPGYVYAQKYPEFTIPVSSADILIQERYNRISIVVTISLFVFSVSEILVLITKILSHRRKSKHNYQITYDY